MSIIGILIHTCSEAAIPAAKPVEKANELYDIGYPTERSEWNALAVADAICEDLMAYDDGCVAPGAPFHRYSARFGFPHTVYLLDTLAYNV